MTPTDAGPSMLQVFYIAGVSLPFEIELKLCFNVHPAYDGKPDDHATSASSSKALGPALCWTQRGLARIPFREGPVGPAAENAV